MRLSISILTFFFVLSFATSTSWLNSSSNSPLSPDEVVAITGATLLDGSGHSPVSNAVVVIKGDSIVAAGKRGETSLPEGARVIDASGLTIAPGFIDTHNHSDRGLNDDPAATTQVSQGITTVAVGQDGGSEFPIGDYLAK